MDDNYQGTSSAQESVRAVTADQIGWGRQRGALTIEQLDEQTSFSTSFAPDLRSLTFPVPTLLSKGGLPDWKMKKVRAFILNNLSVNISADSMAAVCGLSTTHFQRAFGRSFGCSPHRYVTKLRLELARQILLETDWPIKFIALECGMSDQSHFNKVLKREFGITPWMLRRQGRNIAGRPEANGILLS
ncbi:AraC family transcriptional regulator [Rhizobium sp.]|uniref:helix-turn-helix domain-containing protein n=1 Tax=Rhizobium sp. TaxID=391 RepID=UPI0028AE3A04